MVKGLIDENLLMDHFGESGIGMAVAGFSIDQSLLKKQRTRWSSVFPVRPSSSLSVRSVWRLYRSICAA